MNRVTIDVNPKVNPAYTVQRIRKARSICGEEVKSACIIFDTPITQRKNVRLLYADFEKEARFLEETLHNVLPGGTYDALLRRILERKASQLIVSFPNACGRSKK